MSRLLVDTSFAAQTLGVSPSTIRSWKHRGLCTSKARGRWDLVELRQAQLHAEQRHAATLVNVG